MDDRNSRTSTVLVATKSLEDPEVVPGRFACEGCERTDGTWVETVPRAQVRFGEVCNGEVGERGFGEEEEEGRGDVGQLELELNWGERYGARGFEYLHVGPVVVRVLPFFDFAAPAFFFSSRYVVLASFLLVIDSELYQSQFFYVVCVASFHTIERRSEKTRGGRRDQEQHL